MANWIVFSYSLPSKSSSSPRVTLWRRLRRLGAVSPTGGIYILPARPECVEAFQWLAQEIQQAQGQALVMHIHQFEGFSDAQLIELFQQARQEDYAEIEAQLADLEQLVDRIELEERSQIYDTLARLRRQHTDLAQIDYFNSPAGGQVATRLAKVAQLLAPQTQPEPDIPEVEIKAYRDKRWVTRPQPHVDRLACAWLIRRFINPQAVIRYAPDSEPGEVAFDMKGAEFGHAGQLCTFEMMIRAFKLSQPGLALLAEIVHEVDLRDERYGHAEISGLEAILQGWLALNLSDEVLEARGLALFEGLFETLSKR